MKTESVVEVCVRPGEVLVRLKSPRCEEVFDFSFSEPDGFCEFLEALTRVARHAWPELARFAPGQAAPPVHPTQPPGRA